VISVGDLDEEVRTAARLALLVGPWVRLDEHAGGVGRDAERSRQRLLVHRLDEHRAHGATRRQFACILLVTCDASRSDELAAAMRTLESAGLQVTARVTPSDSAAPAPGQRIQLALTGGERAGIIRDVSRVLAERGVNVEELESEVSSAPMSGERLFTARARLRVPPTLALADLRASLEKLAGELMVDLTAE
jgi:glycine cleavage system regulatory protein